MKKKSKKDKKVFNQEESIEMTSEYITSFNQLQEFLKKLPKCHTISSRLAATKNYLEINNNELYNKSIELDGLVILGSWLKEYKKSVGSGTDLTKDEEFIVSNIIYLCEKMHLTKNELISSKIGKNINSLGKVLPEGNQVKTLCNQIIQKWREMIKNNEEENEQVENDEFNQNNSSSQKKTHTGTSDNFSNNQIIGLKVRKNNFNSIPFNNSNIFSNTNNINLNTKFNNTCNKINSIIIKAYVNNSTNFIFLLLSINKKDVFQNLLINLILIIILKGITLFYRYLIL